MGNYLSMADILIWPMTFNASRSNLDLKKWPRINYIKSNLDKIKEFQDAEGTEDI